MKYGDTLRQRSIPEWAYYNIDYDELKSIIKENTTQGRGKALAIPGHAKSSESEFEDSLYRALVEEHDRICLFVKSKCTEIDHRLGLLERQIRHIQLRSQRASNDAPLPSLIVHYGRVEQEAIKAGEEIRNLSRFIGAQRLAITKLLKKYKKWTGSSSLDARFKTDVLSRPDSFVCVNLDSELDHWSDILHIIRTARAELTGSKNQTPLSQSPRNSPALRPTVPLARRERSEIVAGQMVDAIESSRDVDFDVSFANVPVGEDGGKAVYWIHPEQLIELQVLLLQHLRLYMPSRNAGTATPGSFGSIPSSPITVRRPSTSRLDNFPERESDTGFIVIDDVEEFAKRQSGTPISDEEYASAQSFTRPALCARWTTEDEAIVSLRERITGTATVEQRPARVRRKHLGALLDVKRDFVPWRTSGSTPPTDGRPRTFHTLAPDDVRNYLDEHSEMQPLVGVLSRRARFVGLGNKRSCSTWCVLDMDISMKKIVREELAGKDWVKNVARDATLFPYAVLEVRYEGDGAGKLVSILDRSHLTERIRGFTIAAHAVWECWKPLSMAKPFWLSVLSRDIRKVPSTREARSRRPSLQSATTAGRITLGSSATDSGNASSTAAETTTSLGSTPPTPVEARDFADTPLQKGNGRPQRYTGRPPLKVPGVRYWSEYDHPEDLEDDPNAFYLYIDPSAPSEPWPGQVAAQKALNSLYALVTGHSKEKVPDEERALISRGSNDSADSDSEAESSTSESTHARRMRYGTLYDGDPKALPTYIPDASIASIVNPVLALTAALSITLIIGTLALTGRKRERTEVDAGIVFGVASSLVFALVGLVNLMSGIREDVVRLSWPGWIIVGIVCTVVCVGDGMLIGWVVRGGW
ncbi:hypothetical protein EJ06DRAFT_531452 [Trichodelitschia bisporula]|uniref:SPX domain-containing protein n=1 Tax=Trichodelitschia bisporula TaxID=703511 RepID=A0A6G1HTG9_9PEZI|nr:hypothetical protein EJ06DRAFT_531452 [Trichodelitschia bisporula]